MKGSSNYECVYYYPGMYPMDCMCHKYLFQGYGKDYGYVYPQTVHLVYGGRTVLTSGPGL